MLATIEVWAERRHRSALSTATAFSWHALTPSAGSDPNETATDQEVPFTQRLNFDAFFPFQFSTNPGAVRRPPSTQDDFQRTRYCLRGLPRPCFISLSSTTSPSQLCYSSMTAMRDRSPTASILASSYVSPSKPVELEEVGWGFEGRWGLKDV